MTIALARIFVYGFADNQGTRMHRTNLTHQNPVDGAATTMFGLPCAKTELGNVGQADRSALAGGRI